MENSSEQLSYTEKFEKEREEWTGKIKATAAMFRVVENLVDVQVDLYSNRQVAVDYIQSLTVLQNKLKKKWQSEWKAAYEKLSLNEDFRYTEKEKNRFADEATSDRKIKIDNVQAQIDFFRETVRTLDNMIFGVKHRLEIEDFKRGNK